MASSIFRVDKGIVIPRVPLRYPIMVLEDEDGVDGINRRGHNGVVIPHYLIAIHKTHHPIRCQGAGKKNRMLGMAFCLWCFAIIDREVVAATREIHRRNLFAINLLRSHANIFSNLVVLLVDFMVMRDRRKLSRLWRKRWLQIGGGILVHRLKLHVDYRGLVAEINVFFTEQVEQIFGKVFGDERDVLRIVNQNRLVAFFEAGRHNKKH